MNFIESTIDLELEEIGSIFELTGDFEIISIFINDRGKPNQ